MVAPCCGRHRAIKRSQSRDSTSNCIVAAVSPAQIAACKAEYPNA